MKIKIEESQKVTRVQTMSFEFFIFRDLNSAPF